MHEVLEELKQKRTDRSEWKKGKALLDVEDRVATMTATTPAETGLQAEIDTATKELELFKTQRGQMATDILGGGVYNPRHTKLEAEALKKLKDLHLDKVHC